MKRIIAIEIDTDQLEGYADSHLADCWRFAQANPAPISDQDAGDLAERIGREIIRRWVEAIPPELWRHQGKHHAWDALSRLNAERRASGVTCQS